MNSPKIQFIFKILILRCYLLWCSRNFCTKFLCLVCDFISVLKSIRKHIFSFVDNNSIILKTFWNNAYSAKFGTLYIQILLIWWAGKISKVISSMEGASSSHPTYFGVPGTPISLIIMLWIHQRIFQFSFFFLQKAVKTPKVLLPNSFSLNPYQMCKWQEIIFCLYIHWSEPP